MSDRPRLSPAVGLSAIPAPSARRPAIPAPRRRPPADPGDQQHEKAPAAADQNRDEVDQTDETASQPGGSDVAGPSDTQTPDTRSQHPEASLVGAVRGPETPQRPPVQPTRRRGATAAKSAPSETSRQTTILLPAGIAEWLRDTARQTSRTQLAVILDAIEHHHAHLQNLVDESSATTGSASSSGLFPDRPAGRAHNPGLTTTVGIRTTAANLEVIDRIAATTGARNRSHLIALALMAHGAPRQ